MLSHLNLRCQPTNSHLVNIAAMIISLLILLSRLVIAQDDDEPTSSVAQTTSPFVDQVTGLTMERFFGARTQFGLGIALPTAPTGSFIGQMSFPLVGGAGWGALGLTGDMEGNFILAVWPDGAGGVAASFRQATDEDNPPEVRGDFSVRPIAAGVAVNNTFLTYTFLCEQCLDATLGLGPDATGGDAVMGWALSERAVRNPANPAAALGFHERGFGPFTARLGNAAAAGFDAAAALAGAPVRDSGRAVTVTPNAFRDGDGGDGDDDDENEGRVGGVNQGGRQDDGDDGDDDD
jgi:hypothetical protein